ncbi:MAG: hypothetical protein KDD94_08515 [Calditrichaeota bacterium]|nr:hypothetical protein [Calditrichota bacterium]
MKLIQLIFISILLLACAKPEAKPFQITSLKWEVQNSGNNSSIRGIDAVNDSLVWLSGSYGRYAITEDGGKHWVTDSVPGAGSLDFRDIEAFSRDLVYLMSAGSGRLSRLYKTTDGGKNWELQYENTNEQAFFDGFAWWDENNGVLIGDPVDGKHYLLKTTDGGQNWNRIDPDKLAPLAEGEIGGFAASGTTIAVYGDNVWFATGGQTARLHHSPDRGESWQVYDTPMIDGVGTAGIFSIDFRDSLNGVMVGGDFTKPKQGGYNVAYTADGGKNWTAVADTSVVSYRSCVQYIPGTHSLVTVGRGGVGAWSNDDGRTWTRFGNLPFYTLSFAKGSKSAWAAGPNGAVAKLVVE